MNSREKNIKSMGNSSVKIRALEEKWQGKEAQWDKDRRRMLEENKQLKERLEVLRNMNMSLQKLQGISKKKADQSDALLKRCIDLEETNKKLVSILTQLQ